MIAIVPLRQLYLIFQQVLGLILLMARSASTNTGGSCSAGTSVGS
jgi:hypothetical protein